MSYVLSFVINYKSYIDHRHGCVLSNNTNFVVLFFETKSHGIWAVVKLTICVQDWHELGPFASTSQVFRLYIGKYQGFLFFVVVEIQVLSHVRQVSYRWAISPVQLKFIYKITVENWLWKYKAWTHKGIKTSLLRGAMKRTNSTDTK